MKPQIHSQILLALAAAAAAPAATVTGVGVATGPTTLPTAIVVDNTGSASTVKGFKVTRDSATKIASLDAAEILLEYAPGSGTTKTSRILGGNVDSGTRYALQGGSTHKFTQFLSDIPYNNDNGPGSVIEFNAQHGTVANNQFSTPPVLNTPATLLWSGTYTDTSATTNPTDYPLLTFGGAGNKLKLYKDPVNRAGIAGAATPTIVMDPLYGTIDLVGSSPGITVNGVPFLTTNHLRVGGLTTNGSIAVGAGTSVGTNAAAFGSGAAATGTGSFATGENTGATGQYSTAGGTYSTASGNYSFAQGNDTAAAGTASASFGSFTVAEGSYSMAVGVSTYAQGAQSFAQGNSTTSSGLASFASGASTTARAGYSQALGSNTDTWFPGQTTVGRYSLTPGAYTTTPASTTAATDTVFVVGGGTSSVRSNALEVQANGNVKATGTVTATGGAFSQPVVLSGSAVAGDIPMYVP